MQHDERDGVGRDAEQREVDRRPDVDWDAAFEAIVASLRPSQTRRVLSSVGQALLGAAVLATAWWLLATVLAAQMEGLGRPWW